MTLWAYIYTLIEIDLISNRGKVVNNRLIPNISLAIRDKAYS